MLIAKEMSKETESKRKSLSVVARLMGIDDHLLAQQHVPISAKRKLQEDSPSTTLAGALKGCHQEEVVIFNKLMSCELQRYACDKMEFKNAYEVSQKPLRASVIKDQWGNCNENQNETRNAFVHKKFMEGKSLTEDERLLHSKEFQDALEILSSNRDVFLKILQDPDSLFPKHVKNVNMSPPLPKRQITVLKPSQRVETKGENLVTEEQYPMANKSEWGTIKQSSNKHWGSGFTQSKSENFSQPTRIVVLKPSTRKPHDMKAKVTPPTTLCKLLEQSGFFGDLGDSEALGSRSLAKKITQDQRDESLLSSVNVNRCRDKSSFNKSENENAEEDIGRFSDFEIMTPTSRCSWEYTNRTGSPCSALTLSQASNSPNSSVIMEAKKQLLERWALVVSNENNQEQTRPPRCSFSLGEMLAITVVKEGHDDKFTVSSSRSCGREEELELSTSCKTIGKIMNVERESSPGNLSRSKSLPISSSAYEHIGLSGEYSNFWTNESTGPREVGKSKNEKLSFKEKVSSFFFSKLKKTNREKPVSPPLVGSDDKAQSGSAGSAVNKNVESANLLYRNLPMESPQVNYQEISGNTTSPTLVTAATKIASLSTEKSKTCNNLRDEIKFRVCESSKSNQDQPSPTSVLDASFEDTTNVSQSSANAGPHALSRASPIESVSRSLSWDNARLDMPSPYPSKLNEASSKVDNNEHACPVFIQKLLNSSSLERPSMISAECHPLDSSLDPVLLSKFLHWREEQARCREKRSKQNLLFDCVNSALLEVALTGSTTLQSAYPWYRGLGGTLWNVPASSAMSVEVWGLVRDSFSVKTTWAMIEGGNSSLVFDRALMRDVGRYRWTQSMRLEVQEITEEISRGVLKDLVWETLADINAEYL